MDHQFAAYMDPDTCFTCGKQKKDHQLMNSPIESSPDEIGLVSGDLEEKISVILEDAGISEGRAEEILRLVALAENAKVLADAELSKADNL